MRDTKLNGNTTWLSQKAKLKLAFPQLTHAELNFDENRKDEMFSNLQAKLGKTSNELQNIAEGL